MLSLRTGNARAPSISWLIPGSVAAAMALVLSLLWFFEPRWASNLDIAMSMVAHGYGGAAVESSRLIYSNVLWGDLVRAIPETSGILGYSVATFGVLVVAGAAIFYGLRRHGVGYIACLSALVLILTRAILFPQYTINAGLLAVAALLLWSVYAQVNDRRVLIVGCVLAFVSYLVRSQEFLLVLIVALPLLPWRTLLSHRAEKIAFLVLISAIAVAAVIDHRAYRGNDWSAFNELNSARWPFVGQGAGERLKQHPDILARHGYSENDIDLLGQYFFVDPSLANPQALKKMLADMGPPAVQDGALVGAWRGVQTLWRSSQFPPALVVAALLLAALRPSWQLAVIGGLGIEVAFALGVRGAPQEGWASEPVLYLLIIGPLLGLGKASTWGRRCATGTLLVAAAINATYAFTESSKLQLADYQTRQTIAEFPHYPVVIWGGQFPVEASYPALRVPPAAREYRFYSLGAFALAPFSVSFVEQAQGRGLTDLLISENGVAIVADTLLLERLDIYCLKRFHGQLQEISTELHGKMILGRRRCA
jgi:hypothetical protein